MSLIRYIQKLQLLDKLISRKSTGNQISFCKKTNMSRSLLNNYIKEMKELGFPIEYDKKRQTYYYSEEGRLTPNLFIQEIGRTEMNQKTGGASHQSITVLLKELGEICCAKFSPNILD